MSSISCPLELCVVGNLWLVAAIFITSAGAAGLEDGLDTSHFRDTCAHVRIPWATCLQCWTQSPEWPADAETETWWLYPQFRNLMWCSYNSGLFKTFGGCSGERGGGRIQKLKQLWVFHTHSLFTGKGQTCQYNPKKIIKKFCLQWKYPATWCHFNEVMPS